MHTELRVSTLVLFIFFRLHLSSHKKENPLTTPLKSSSSEDSSSEDSSSEDLVMVITIYIYDLFIMVTLGSVGKI